MTVPSLVPINTYEGNSYSVTFDFDFLIESSSELVVKYYSETGESVTLEEGTDYSIHEIGNPSGSYISFPLSSSQYQILKPNEHISLSLNLVIKQENEFRNSRYFNFDILEWTFDYIVRILQMLSQKLDKCFQLPDSSEINPNTLIEELVVCKNQSVQAAASAQSSAESATAAAEVAVEKETSIIEKSQEFDETFEECMAEISELPEVANKANKHLSNLAEDGEKHFLNKTQITNCITEVPQRIKYTLQDNTTPQSDTFLTILSGSIIIVPYGTEDVSSEYPAGSSFENDNFEVYDSQYTNGKFYLWLKLLNDINHVHTSLVTETASVIINITDSSAVDWGTAYIKSGTGGNEGNNFYYNTSTNLFKKYSSGSADGKLYSLPLMIIKKDSGIPRTVENVFNGIGYVGSCVFVDKGVKGLVPDGINKDGTLKNTVFENTHLQIGETTTDKYSMITLRTSEDPYYANGVLCFTSTDNISADEYLPSGVASYISELNIWRGKNGSTYYNIHWLPCGYICNVSGVITNFSNKFPCRFAEKQNVDGSWVSSTYDIAINTALPTSSDNTLEYSLSSYLPNDGCNYEVLFTGQVNTGASATNQGALILHTDIITGQIWLCRAITHTNAVAYSMGTAVLPIGTKRKIYVAKSNATTSATFSLAVRGYRRIGNNI